MYGDYGMSGLAGVMEDVKAHWGDAAATGGGVILGVGIAKFVTDYATTLGMTKDAAGNLSGEATLPNWLPPLFPVLVGTILFSKFADPRDEAGEKSRLKMALGAANGAGMIAYGLAVLAKRLIAKSENASAMEFAKNYIALGAVDTYESPILAGLGNYGPINSYLRPGVNGLGEYGMRSSGAPTFVEMAGLGSAPTQFQEVRGSVNGFHGLGAAPSSVELVPSGLGAVLM